MKKTLIATMFGCLFAYYASGGEPTPQEECPYVLSDGTILGDLKQWLICSIVGPDVPGCGDGTGCVECKCIDSNGSYQIVSCPVALPSPGKPVKLSFNLDKRENIADWQMPVSFGPRRPMNYLYRAKWNPQAGFIELYMPEKTSTALFVSTKGEDIFRLAPQQRSLPENAYFVREGSQAILRFPDGRRMVFAEDPAQPQVYRVIELADRWSGATKVRYEERAITVTDAAGQDYRCEIDDTNRIESIMVLGRVWRYEYTDSSVTEILPDNSRDILENLPDGRFISRTLTDGIVSEQLRFHYDAAGEVVRAQEGNVVFDAMEIEQDGLTHRTFKRAGQRLSVVLDERLGLIRKTMGENDTLIRINNRDRMGNVTKTKDALGRLTEYDYSDDGLLLREKDPSGFEVRYR